MRNTICLVVLLAAGSPSVETVLAQDAEDVPGTTTDTTSTIKEVGLSADRFVGTRVGSEPVRKLIGNVRLVQDETTLRSALATQWVDAERILFEGQVFVVDEGDTLRADSVLYFRRTKIGNATGNVILNDDEVVVTSTEAVYDVENKHSHFERGVTLVDSVSTLTGGKGDYYSDDERAHFYEGINFEDSTSTITADSLVYYRETELASAFGTVLVSIVEEASDTTALPDIIRIAGPEASTDRKERRNKITGRAVALRLEADTTGAYTDTLLVNADSLTAQRSDSADVLLGSGNVLIWSPDVAALADSLVITEDVSDGNRDEILLTGEPIVWMDESQLLADTIKVFVVDGDVDSVYAVGTVFLARPDSVSGRIQQVTGRTLFGTIQSDDKKKFIIGPNAEAIHYVSRDDHLQGAVRTSADRIVFYIKGEDPVRISVLRGVEGLYYQAEDIPPSLGLTGFRWQAERRPDKVLLVSEWPSYMKSK